MQLQLLVLRETTVAHSVNIDLIWVLCIWSSTAVDIHEVDVRLDLPARVAITAKIVCQVIRQEDRNQCLRMTELDVQHFVLTFLLARCCCCCGQVSSCIALESLSIYAACENYNDNNSTTVVIELYRGATYEEYVVYYDM